MQHAALPRDEPLRLARLHALSIVDTQPEPLFQTIAEAAARVCGAPIALVSLVDEKRQWFKASVGIEATETPRDIAFCAHTVLSDDVMEVEDARNDLRFADNPLVTGAMDVRFYAGAPLRLTEGSTIGSLCVIDHSPRRLTSEQTSVLRTLAESVVHAIEARAKALTALALYDQVRASGALSGRAPADPPGTTIESDAATTTHGESVRNARILEGTSAGMWECNLLTSDTRFSARWAEIVGYSLDELGSTTVATWSSRVHPQDLTRVNAEIKANLQRSPSFNLENRLRHKDGSWIWVHDHVSVTERSASGRPLYLHGICTDITARKQAEVALRASQLFLERVGQLAGVGGWSLDIRTRSMVWSTETCRLHERPPHFSPTLEDVLGHIAPEARELVVQTVRNSVERGESFDLELPMISRTGRLFWARTIGAVELEDGHAVRLVGAMQDITDRRQGESDLAQSRQLLQVTLDSIADAVITTDTDSRVQWLNPVAERITGWDRLDAVGRRLTDIFSIVDETTREPVQDPASICLARQSVIGRSGRTTLIARTGQFGIEHSASPIRDGAGQVHGAVVVFRDVSEQRRLTDELNHRATHDLLTGLLNRSEFEARLTRLLEARSIEATENVLLYIDLDQFKLVNDACGHGAGDHLLREVGAILGNCVRAHDSIARLGGDEFGMILGRCDLPSAQRIAQRICDEMDAFRFTHELRRFRIGTSIGLVVIDERWTCITDLLQVADASCYAAKEGGRNRVHTWFDSDLIVEARHGDMQWVSRLELALDEDGFELFGQRIESIGSPSGGIHFEVLLRKRETNGTLIPPGAFLPVAERFHLATRIDRWVVRNAFDWMQRIDGGDERIEMMAINLSGQSLGDRAFHQDVLEMVDNATFDVRKLCFEITETAAITHLADARTFIEKIRTLGVKVALDDFGAGASSFGYLKSLPVDFLKIDGHFIKHLLDDDLNNVAVRCFCDVARVVGVKTIAEFVETSEVREALRCIGVDMAQGYLFHRPEPLDALLAEYA